MTILSWETPKRVRSHKKHVEMYQADVGIPGTYVPNMSEEDKLRWKAHLVTGEDPRVEIRKAVKNRFSYLLVAVVRYTHDLGLDVELSLNGKAHLNAVDWQDLNTAIREAYTKLVEERLTNTTHAGRNR